MREARKAAELLRREYSVVVDNLSVTSFNELRREALDITRENMLNPLKNKNSVWYPKAFNEKRAGFICNDYMKIHSDQIREFVPDVYRVLETVVLVK